MVDIFGLAVVILLVVSLWSMLTEEREEEPERDYDVVMVKKYMKKR